VGMPGLSMPVLIIIAVLNSRDWSGCKTCGLYP
jgi:hypothetical protein